MSGSRSRRRDEDHQQQKHQEQQEDEEEEVDQQQHSTMREEAAAAAPTLSTTRTNTKNATPFQERSNHELEYGLKITQRDAETNEVVSVRCQFCSYFGREEKATAATASSTARSSDSPPIKRRRRARTTIQVFKRPFRVDNYKCHLESQHPRRWAEYSQLSTEEKKTYFDKTVPPLTDESLSPSVRLPQVPSRLRVKRRIVDVIIGELLFDEDDEADVSGDEAEVEADEDSDSDIVHDIEVIRWLEEGGGEDGIDDDEDVHMASGQRDCGEEEGAGRLRSKAKLRALASFESGVDNGSAEAARAFYNVTIGSSLENELILSYVGLGVSFRQASGILRATKETTGLATVGDPDTSRVTSLVRVAVAVNLTALSDIMESVWAFSLALDSSTHRSTSYLDVRVRFGIRGNLYDFHLLALPFFEEHSGEEMFKVLQKMLDAMCPSWTSRLIGVATDGVANMTDGIRGIVSRIKRVVLPGFVRVSSGAQQLDLAMQHIFKDLLQGDFYTQLTRLIGYLRHQQSLIGKMKTKCPRLSTATWLSVGTVARWLCKHSETILRYLTLKSPGCAPTMSWWLTIHGVDALMTRVDITFKRLQGLTNLVAEEVEELKALWASICSLAELQERPSEEILRPSNAEAEDVVVYGQYAVQISSVRAFLENQGPFVVDLVEEVQTLEAESVNRPLKAIGRLLVTAAEKINSIAAERTSPNAAAQKPVPPVLPQQLVLLPRPKVFYDMLKEYKDRLGAARSSGGVKRGFGDILIDRIEDEYRELKLAYQTEKNVKIALKRMMPTRREEALQGGEPDANPGGSSGGTSRERSREERTFSFAESWSACGPNDRLPYLCAFSGGLATVFQGTSSTAESDFSVMAWEKDDSHSKLTDLTLEGVLHCKQRDALAKVKPNAVL